mmetsp:Transcript_70853/g.188387  ORF Transcript_70853/g.188387 Transcript_70853/m.188387 type:complete len:206 (-) Transcript_70853:72-689(-)
MLGGLVDVDRRPEHHVGAQGLELLTDGPGDLTHQVGVPSGRECQVRREDRDPLGLLETLGPVARDSAHHLQAGDRILRERWDLSLVSARLGVQELVQGVIVQPVRNPAAVRRRVLPPLRPQVLDLGIIGAVVGLRGQRVVACLHGAGQRVGLQVCKFIIHVHPHVHVQVQIRVLGIQRIVKQDSGGDAAREEKSDLPGGTHRTIL